MTDTGSDRRTTPQDLESDSTPKLFRSSDERMVAGVCGGLGDYFNIDAIWFRLAFVMLAIGGGTSAIVYLLLWLVVPERSQIDAPSSLRANPPPPAMIVGLALTAFGTMMLVTMVDRSIGRFFWPALLVVAGLLLVTGRRSHDGN